MGSRLCGRCQWFLKRAFGREDFITEVRKQYQDIKVRSAVSNLPPGVASDKDIQLVLAPWPTIHPTLIWSGER